MIWARDQLATTPLLCEERHHTSVSHSAEDDSCNVTCQSIHHAHAAAASRDWTPEHGLFVLQSTGIPAPGHTES